MFAFFLLFFDLFLPQTVKLQAQSCETPVPAGSLETVHYQYNGLPVWGLEVHRMHLTPWHSKIPDVLKMTLIEEKPEFNEPTIRRQLQAKTKLRPYRVGTIQKGFFIEKNKLISVFKTDWSIGVDSFLRVFSSGPRVIKSFPLQFNKNVTIHVFSPNPIVVTGDYNLRDHEDSRDAVPFLAYQEETIEVIDQNSLKNVYAMSTQISPPDLPSINSSTLPMNFYRDEPQFEEANILFHITQAQNFIQNLGFINLQNRPMPFDAHGLSGADQSAFSIYHDPAGSLEFGDGGVDDAEDADIIYHEYFHALHFALAGEGIFLTRSNPDIPVENQTNEPGVIAEATADYFAYAMTLDSNNAHGMDARWFGEWDVATDDSKPGHSPFLRSGRANLHYPEDMTGQYQQDSQVLTQALIDIREANIVEEIDVALLTTLSLLPPESLIRDFCYLFIQVDQALNGERSSDELLDFFLARGLKPAHVQMAQISPMKEDDFVSLGIFNPNASQMTCDLNVFNEYGTLLSNDHIELLPDSKGSILLDRFPEPETIKSLEIRSAEPLACWVQHISHDLQEHSTYLVGNSNSKVFVPHVSENREQWETQVQITNTSIFEKEIILNEAGLVSSLPSHGWSGFLFSQERIEINEGWGSFSSQGSVSGFEAFWKIDENARQRASLPLSGKLSRNWTIAHVATDTETFWTGISIVNPSESTNDIQIKALHLDGNLIESASLFLEPHKKWKGLASELFGDLKSKAVSHLEISAQHPITGFELFGTNDDQTLAGLPFLSDSFTRLIVPFTLQNSEGWMGLVLFNPNDIEVTLNLDGTGFNESPITKNLEAHTKYSVLISTLWDTIPESLKISSSGPVMGLVVFGDHQRTWMDAMQLSGTD